MQLFFSVRVSPGCYWKCGIAIDRNSACYVFLLREILIYKLSGVVMYMLIFNRRIVICFMEGISPYRAVNIFRNGYKNQSVNAV